MRKLLPAVLALLVACTSAGDSTSTSTASGDCVEARVIYDDAAYEIGDLADAGFVSGDPSFRLVVLTFANVAELFPECFTPTELVRAATAKDTLEFLNP